MAKNRVHLTGKFLSLAATQPATPASGDPVLVGQLPGVATTAERTDGTTSIQTDGVYNLSVGAVAGAIAIGDLLYYVVAETPKVSRTATGVRFGYALGAITSGQTATIPVKVGY